MATVTEPLSMKLHSSLHKSTFLPNFVKFHTLRKQHAEEIASLSRYAHLYGKIQTDG